MTTVDIVKIIKHCGQSIIDNAESIAGDYDHQTDLTVTIRLSMEDKMPVIETCSQFIPEGFCTDETFGVIRVDEEGRLI